MTVQNTDFCEHCLRTDENPAPDDDYCEHCLRPQPSPVAAIEREDVQVSQQTFTVGFDDKGGPHINVDKFTTEPLTESECWSLRHRLGVRMATKGFRSQDEIEQAIKSYLHEIGKSNEGKVFWVGMGWMPIRREVNV